jgi:hypothetical protein
VKEGRWPPIATSKSKGEEAILSTKKKHKKEQMKQVMNLLNYKVIEMISF